MQRKSIGIQAEREGKIPAIAAANTDQQEQAPNGTHRSEDIQKVHDVFFDP